MLLGHHGVPSLSVERHAGTAIHPRAGHFQLRTMEVIRQIGLEERVRAKSLETYSPTGGIIAVESLAGRELATYVQELNEGVEGFSPTVRVFINQDALEPLLRERALELGATVRNRTEAVAVEQDDDGATVTLRDLDSGDERTVRARYVVAADGNRSPMRARLGIGMRGHAELSRSITIYFRADCAELLRDRNQGVIYVHNPELRGFFRIDRSGGNGFLVINTVGEDVTQDSAIDVQSGLTEERALELLRSAIGDGHADGDRRRRQLARGGDVRRAAARGPRVPRRRRGARRAAQRRLRRQHRASRTPTTSRGSWPRSSRARPGRRCSTATRPSACRSASSTSSRPTRATPRASCPSAGPTACSRRSPTSSSRSAGSCARRRSQPVEGDDGALHLAPAALDGRPGTRAPHLTLGDGRSTLDLFGSQFVVLRPAGDGVDDWAPPGVASHVIDADAFAGTYGLAAGGATLVRPDGVIAWRSRGPAGRPEIERAMATALALDRAASAAA